MMAITLADLRGQCRGFLTSETIWSDDMLTLFINDGIRAYSNYLPRRLRHSLALTTGTQAYDLPGGHGFVRLLAVEYPTGESPPIYLTQVEEWDSLFVGGGDVYALRAVADDLAADEDTMTGLIVFAETVATGETATLTYTAVHDAVSDDDDVLTVPEAHMEAIIAFVDFRAHWERESNETYSGSSSSLILSQLGENGRRAWNRYREIVRTLAPVGGWQIQTPSWGNIGL